MLSKFNYNIFFDVRHTYHFSCDVGNLVLREGPVAAVDTTDTPGAASSTDNSDAFDLKGIYAMAFVFKKYPLTNSVNPRLKIKEKNCILMSKYVNVYSILIEEKY